MTGPTVEALAARVKEAEEIIRAQVRLEIAMYDSDFEVSWPRDASDLKAAYQERYGVDLDPEDDDV